MMLPVAPGKLPVFTYFVDATAATTLRAELRVSEKPANHTPDTVLKVLEIPLAAGKGNRCSSTSTRPSIYPRCAFVCLMTNEHIAVHLSEQRVTGILAVSHNQNKAVAKSATQTPPPGCGIDTFEYWTPKRRPEGRNFAMRVEPPLAAFSPANLTNGFDRPTNQTNAWAAGFERESGTDPGVGKPGHHRVPSNWPSTWTTTTRWSQS